MKIFSGNSNKELALAIAAHLGATLADCEVFKFSDGEIGIDINESVRGEDCFIIQSICPPVNDNLMELLVLVDALKRASAQTIRLIIPYFGYSRQDRKARPRQPISAKLVADMITAAGADRIAMLDLHTAQIQGFFNIPVDSLYAKPIILNYVLENFKDTSDLVFVSPDAGGMTRVDQLVRNTDWGIAMLSKKREKPGVIREMQLVGDVAGKTVFIVDDIIDSGGTLCRAAETLLKHGAKKVFAYGSHAIFSGNAYDNICTGSSPFERVLVSNTIPLDNGVVSFYENKYGKKIEVLDVSLLFAKAIQRIYKNQSVSDMFT